MNSYQKHLAEDRRLCILRLLVETNGTANNSVLHAGLESLGHRPLSRTAVTEDIRFLINNGCVTDEWCGDVQIVQATRRGVDVANGSEQVEGIKRPSIGV